MRGHLRTIRQAAAIRVKRRRTALTIRIEQAGRLHRRLERGLERSKLADQTIARLPQRHRAVGTVCAENDLEQFLLVWRQLPSGRRSRDRELPLAEHEACSSIRSSPRSASDNRAAIPCSRRGDPLARSRSGDDRWQRIGRHGPCGMVEKSRAVDRTADE